MLAFTLIQHAAGRVFILYCKVACFQYIYCINKYLTTTTKQEHFAHFILKLIFRWRSRCSSQSRVFYFVIQSTQCRRILGLIAHNWWIQQWPMLSDSYLQKTRAVKQVRWARERQSISMLSEDAAIMIFVPIRWIGVATCVTPTDRDGPLTRPMGPGSNMTAVSPPPRCFSIAILSFNQRCLSLYHSTSRTWTCFFF